MKFRTMLSALLLAAGVVFVAGCGKKAEAKTDAKTDKKAEAKTDKKDAAKVDVAAEKKAAVAAFEEFKAAIAKGDADKAFALTTPEPGKKSIWKEEIAKYISNPESQKRFAAQELEKFKLEPAEDKEFPNVSFWGTLHMKNGLDVYMLKVDGQWKIMDVK